jgi:hypothetical protein
MEAPDRRTEIGLRSSTKEFEHLLSDLYFRLDERDRWADQTIKYLLFGNGGGVGLLMAFLGNLTKAGVWLPLILFPLGFFVLGLIFVGKIVRGSTRSIRQGRRHVRKLISAYLAEEIEYSEAFDDMGKFNSKWEHFEGASKLSFFSMIAGIVFSAMIYLIQPLAYQYMPVAQTSAFQQAPADIGKTTQRPAAVGATTQPADDPSLLKAQGALPRSKTEGKSD